MERFSHYTVNSGFATSTIGQNSVDYGPPSVPILEEMDADTKELFRFMKKEIKQAKQWIETNKQLSPSKQKEAIEIKQTMKKLIESHKQRCETIKENKNHAPLDIKETVIECIKSMQSLNNMCQTIYTE